MSPEPLLPLDLRSLRENPWSMIADRWMLITAGGPADRAGAWNTMTASWGGFGHLWNRDVAYIFVRPTRHTFGFLNRADGFVLSFFDEEYRAALRICGSASGRNTDKADAAGLTPLPFGDDAHVGFAQASLELKCRILHRQDLDPEGFADPSIGANYRARDWHRLYVGEIEAARGKT